MVPARGVEPRTYRLQENCSGKPRIEASYFGGIEPNMIRERPVRVFSDEKLRFFLIGAIIFDMTVSKN